MDMGINGKKAIVCASSRGLGKGCAEALASEGVNLVINGRNKEVLSSTARELREKYEVNVIEFCADITSKEQQNELIKICPNPDILVNNAGGPPPGDFRDWNRDDWMNACIANMFTPIELIKAYVDGMQDRKFGRIINITSSSVKAPIDILGLSNGARSGLTGFVAGIARKTIINNVTINSILPGPFDTDRLRNSFKFVSEKTGKSIEEVREARAAENPSGRFGTPKEFGVACAYLCSSYAGYITGQNLLIDGGGYPGTY
ncbi:MAG: SDR family oxidoreductase [Alphaproteobacteria bacterium]